MLENMKFSSLLLFEEIFGLSWYFWEHPNCRNANSTKMGLETVACCLWGKSLQILPLLLTLRRVGKSQNKLCNITGGGRGEGRIRALFRNLLSLDVLKLFTCEKVLLLYGEIRKDHISASSKDKENKKLKNLNHHCFFIHTLQQYNLL